MRRQRNSRLARTSEKQNKRQALFFAVGTVLLIFVLIQFGPLLINVFGNVVYTLRGGDAVEQVEVGKELLQPPTLIGIPDATQSAQISFSGTAPSPIGSVEIYVNNELKDEITLDNDAVFSIKSLSLTKGENMIKARYIKDGKTSSFSTDFQVNYLADKPKLDVSFPIDNATFSRADKNITVKGTTDPENAVTVNSSRAIVDSTGEFTYLLQLNDGDNQINIEAINPAGVSYQKSLKVSYHP